MNQDVMVTNHLKFIFNIYFRHLIANIDFLKSSKNLVTVKMKIVVILRNSDTKSYSTDFCKMLIGGRKIVYIDSFCEVTNSRKVVQNDSLEFDELHHKMLSY